MATAAQTAFNNQMADIAKGTRPALTGNALEYATSQGLNAQGKSNSSGVAIGNSGVGNLSNILVDGNESDLLQAIVKELGINPSDLGIKMLPLSGTNGQQAHDTAFFAAYGFTGVRDFKGAKASGIPFIAVDNQGGWSSFSGDYKNAIISADPRIAQAMNENIIRNGESYGQARTLYNTDGTRSTTYVPDSMSSWTRSAMESAGGVQGDVMTSKDVATIKAGNTVPTANSSAEELAAYVKANGTTNLQNYDWWKNNPNKTAAWDLVKPSETATEPTAETPATTPEATTDAAGQPATKTYPNGTIGYLGKNGTYYNSVTGARNEGGGYVGDASNAYQGALESSGLTQEEIDAAYDEYVKLQSAFLSDPELRDQLLGEITYFDETYQKIYDNLAEQRGLAQEKITNSFNDTIAEINLSQTYDEKGKNEAIKSATDGFLDTMDGLNFSSRTAYQAAVKSLTTASETAGNTAAASFLDTIAKKGGGNLATLNANQLVRSLQAYRTEVQQASDTQQEEIMLKSRAALKTLEQTVGSEKAQQMIDSVTSDDFLATGANLDAILAGKTTGLEAATSGALATAAGTTDPYAGAVPLSYDKAAASRDLAKASAIASQGLNTRINEANYQADLTATKQNETASKVQTLQSQLPNIKYYYDPTANKFTVGQQAVTQYGAKAKSIKERTPATLPANTFDYN